jgi:hypothetical protein
MYTEDEEIKETKIRYLAMYQIVKGQTCLIGGVPSLEVEILRVRFKEYLSRRTERVLREGKFNWGHPLFLVLEVDGVIKVFRFGDRVTAAQYRKEKDVTADLPAKVRKLLESILKMVELEKQKLETMKKLIPATIAHYYKEDSNGTAADTGCDEKGEQAGLPEGGTEGAASPGIAQAG